MKVTFQFGMHKEELAAEEASFSSLVELAAMFVSKCVSIMCNSAPACRTCSAECHVQMICGV